MTLLLTPVTPVKYCDECNTPLWGVASNRQKYCYYCKQSVKREQWRENTRGYRKRWNIILKEYRYEAIGHAFEEHGPIMNQYFTGKGTGSLGPHRTGDFDEELKKIKKERRRLMRS